MIEMPKIRIVDMKPNGYDVTEARVVATAGGVRDVMSIHDLIVCSALSVGVNVPNSRNWAIVRRDTLHALNGRVC